MPRDVVGASASETMPLRPHRGTEPYSANVIASMTVDLPEPVGPTSAKKSASVKSILAASRNEANPFISSTIGRIGASSSARAVTAGGRGDLVVQPREQRRHPRVLHLLLGAVVGEQLIGAAAHAGRVGAARARRRGELGIDPHLEGVGQHRGRVVAQAGRVGSRSHTRR